MAYLITECRIHGTKETADKDSAIAYSAMATECIVGREAEDLLGHSDHSDWHASEGHDCWKCCNLMHVIERRETCTHGVTPAFQCGDCFWPYGDAGQSEY